MRFRLMWLSCLLLSCTRGATPDSAPIALTPTEYNNTIRDLLVMPERVADWPAAPALLDVLAPTGEHVDVFGLSDGTVDPWPWPFPDEPGLDEFEGFADGQAPSAYQVEQLQKAAVHYGVYALASPDFFTCDNWSSLAPAAQRSCGWQSIQRFASRAWRRPLTDDELGRLEGLWDGQWTKGTPDEAIALTAAGVLQAPQFVYRLEGLDSRKKRGRVPLNDYELASRLSYFLWDTMPDEALFRAAAEGKLTKPGKLEEQVDRMLADPRAREAVVHFHHQWLGTEDVLQIAPSRAAYGPTFGLTPEPPLDTTGDGDWPLVLGPLRHAMYAEVGLFVTSTLFDGAGTLEALLTDNHGWVADDTAVLYGDFEVLPLPSVTIQGEYVVASGQAQSNITLTPATWSPDQRAGLLTLPAVLAIGSHPVHPSPILRGKRVLERVTCTDLGTPPAGAEALQPSDAVDAEQTNRVRTEVATEAPGCASCHDTLNPMGFAYENYDSLGGWRTTDNGLPVDASGSVALRDGTIAFDNAVDLARQLASSTQVRTCYAQRWLDYAVGVPIDPTDPDAAALLADFEKEDDVLRLLGDIATSEFFRFRSAGGAP